jgi:hypothetical protein
LNECTKLARKFSGHFTSNFGVNIGMTLRGIAQACLGGLFLFVAAFQVRASLETIHLGKNLDYWVPFWVEAFSNRINGDCSWMRSRDPLASQVPERSRGQMRLLAVNRLPFRGMAMYLTRLRNRHPTIGTDGSLVVRVSYGGMAPLDAQFMIPHCTCGTTPTEILAELYLVAPMLCCLLGFSLFIRRPDSLDVWGMCALLLACSQLSVLGEGSGFQITVSPMSWPDWLRIPGTAYQAFARNVWPAALVIVTANMFGRKEQLRRVGRWLALPLFLACLVRVALAVAWSEDYLPFVATYQWMESHRTVLLAIAFLTTGFVSFLHSRIAGASVMLLALAGVSALYWPAGAVLHGAERSFSGVGSISSDYTAGELYSAYKLFVPSLPTSAAMPEAITGSFAVGAILVFMALERRRLPRSLVFCLLLLVFPAGYLIRIANGGFYPFGSLAVVECLLGCAAVGLARVWLWFWRDEGQDAGGVLC